MKTLQNIIIFTFVLLVLAHANTQSKLLSDEHSDKNVYIYDLKMLYEQQFANLATLPHGWKIPGNNPGRIYIDHDFLWIDGRQNALVPTSLILPNMIHKNKNYQIEMEFTLADVVNSSRWAGLIYQVHLAQGVLPIEYYQFTIRQNAKLHTGTEFGRKLGNGQWQVDVTAPYLEEITPHRIYKARVQIMGDRVMHYLDEHLVQDIELADWIKDGEIGFSTAGALMKIKSVKISEILENTPHITDSKQLIQNRFIAPLLIAKQHSSNQHTSDLDRALFYTIDQKLNLKNIENKAEISLSEFLKTKPQSSILVLNVQDLNTIESLKFGIHKSDFEKIILVSKKFDLLQAINAQIPWVVTALDVRERHDLKSNRESLKNIVRSANMARTKIVILPKSLMNKSDVRYIQQRLLNVWLDSSIFPEETSVIALILTLGANGILTTEPEKYNQLVNKLSNNTLLRRPFMIGHRGVPSLEDENTIESTLHAIKLGADLVENDIQLSKDLKIVVMHDNTVDRTTTGKGLVTDLTWKELEGLRTKNKHYKIPLLTDYFKILKQHKNVVLMVELKSANPELIPLLKKELEHNDVIDQVVLTSFNHEQILRVKQQIPEISTGILIGYLPNHASLQNNVQQVVQQSHDYGSSYHPPYRQDLVRLFHSTQAFGVSFWPWNLNDQKFKSLYVAGLSGVTTDHIQNYSNYVIHVQAKPELSIRVGQALDIDLTLKLQNAETIKSKTTRVVVLDGSPKYAIENGQLTFLTKGTAYVLAEYTHTLDAGNQYSVLSAPIKVKVK